MYLDVNYVIYIQISPYVLGVVKHIRSSAFIIALLSIYISTVINSTRNDHYQYFLQNVDISDVCNLLPEQLYPVHVGVVVLTGTRGLLPYSNPADVLLEEHLPSLPL